MTMAMDSIGERLTTPEFFAGPGVEALYAELRATDPVRLTKGRLSRPFWSVTRYREAQQVYKGDDGLFSM